MFEKIFKGLERAHGCTKVTAPAENGVKLKGQSFVVRQPVTTELWKMHLDGKQSLGIIPINEDNQCIWGCVGCVWCGLVEDQGVYTIAKSFADQVGKGNVEVKHGSDESKTDSPY